MVGYFIQWVFDPFHPSKSTLNEVVARDPEKSNVHMYIDEVYDRRQLASRSFVKVKLNFERLKGRYARNDTDKIQDVLCTLFKKVGDSTHKVSWITIGRREGKSGSPLRPYKFYLDDDAKYYAPSLNARTKKKITITPDEYATNWDEFHSLRVYKYSRSERLAKGSHPDNPIAKLHPTLGEDDLEEIVKMGAMVKERGA